jgi:hypothetical protein
MHSHRLSRVPGRALRRPLLGALVLGLLGAGLAGCDGANLFQVRPFPEPPPPPPDARAEVLRYVEEGTLLTSDEARLRFRWMGTEPRIRFDASVPPREAQAFRRGIGLVAEAGGPVIVEVGVAPTIVVEAFPPAEYRELDPTRPWSFSRTFVTATPEAGITEVRIVLSLDLEQPVLERAALHALGHAVGIMGHPAFPGDAFVMANSPEGAPPPVSFHRVERDAIRFLYGPTVAAGMTRAEIRSAFEGFSL